MPLSPDPTRIIIVGDSHMGSLKLAHEAGLIAWPDGADVEFWGAAGPLFRQITWSRGALRAKGEAQDMVKRINANGRTFIAAKDFDVALFYGARLRVSDFFGSYLEWRSQSGGWPSHAAMVAAARFFLSCTRAYRDACAFSAAGTRAVFCPAPFATDGVTDLTKPDRFLGGYPAATTATAEDRARLWRALQDAAGADGVTLMAQPEDTVTKGLLTQAQYAREDAIPNKDAGHKCPEFAARWMQDVLPTLAAHKRAA